MLKVIYFAKLKEIIGLSEEIIKIDKPCTIFSIIEMLKKKDKKYCKAFKDLSVVKCSINHNYAEFSEVVSDEDEISFFPPVTGG